MTSTRRSTRSAGVPGRCARPGAPSPVLCATPPTYRTGARGGCAARGPVGWASPTVARMTQRGGRAAAPMAGATVVDGVDVRRLALAEPGRRLHDLPAALPLPHDRQAARAASPDAVRGTVVHKVLEDLFDLPAADRTPERAAELLEPAWEALLDAEPELAELFAARGARDRRWLVVVPREPGALLHPRGPAAARARRAGDVRRDAAGQPAAAARLRRPARRRPDRRGPSGGLQDRPVARAEVFEAKALFQMKFYALVLWRLAGPSRRCCS